MLKKLAQKLIFKGVNFSIEEELEIALIKEFNMESHIKGCHTYMKEWVSKIGEIRNSHLEPENAINKFAVAVQKEEQIV